MTFDPDTVGTIGNQILLIIAALTALVGMLINLVVTIKARNTSTAERQVIAMKVDDLGGAVNGNLNTVVRRVDQLTTVIADQGLPIPPLPESVQGTFTPETKSEKRFEQ